MAKTDISSPAYKNLIVLSDFNCEVSTAQVEMQFRNVYQWVLDERAKRSLMPKEIKLNKLPTGFVENSPAVMHAADVPFGNVDYAAYSLYQFYRTLGRSRPNIFIHSTASALSQTKSILVTDYGNTFVGPNNGSLGLMKKYFDERDIPCKIYEIDVEKVEELEQHRMEEPTYHVPSSFHGRDIFAVVAGLLAGGIHPADISAGKAKNSPVAMPFASDVKAFPERIGEQTNFMAFRDTTRGNLRTNLTLDALTFDQMVDEGAKFLITATNTEAKWWQPKRKVMEFTAKRIFTEHKKGKGILYLGTSFAPEWDQRFIGLAINMDNASKRLGLPRSYDGAQEVMVERIS